MWEGLPEEVWSISTSSFPAKLAVPRCGDSEDRQESLLCPDAFVDIHFLWSRDWKRKALAGRGIVLQWPVFG